MTEEWRPVVGFEGLYEVSNLGRVASLPRPGRRKSRIVMVQTPDWAGYPRLMLRANRAYANRKVHVLVAEAFHGVRPTGLVVRHLNGVPTDNSATNLAWGTHAENADDMRRHGTHHNAGRTHCRKGHPLSGSNLYVKADGGRQCRACQSDAKSRYEARKKASA